MLLLYDRLQKQRGSIEICPEASAAWPALRGQTAGMRPHQLQNCTGWCGQRKGPAAIWMRFSPGSILETCETRTLKVVCDFSVYNKAWWRINRRFTKLMQKQLFNIWINNQFCCLWCLTLNRQLSLRGISGALSFIYFIFLATILMWSLAIIQINFSHVAQILFHK